MSVATFNDTMYSLICEIDDRKIYNDIRSQIDVTVTEVVLDEEAEYGIISTWGGYFWDTCQDLAANETIEDEIIHAHREHTDIIISWDKAWAEARIVADGTELDFDVTITEETVKYYASGKYEILYVDVTNPLSEAIEHVRLYAEYTYLVRDETSHPETNTRTVTVNVTDATSIDLFGRRELNLTWALGQTQTQMESIIAGYLAIYKDPLPYLIMTLKGTIDALILQIFTRKISDRITIVSSGLGLNADFFINGINIYDDAEGILTGVYLLEQVPAIYAVSLFTLDSSSLDGPDILAL